MAKIIIRGWKKGLLKISMTKSIQNNTSLGLAKSKDVTDRVLNGEQVVIDIENMDIALKLVNELNQHGAIAEIENVG